MSAATPIASEYDASPEVAIEAIVSYGGMALVDLDETLYLRNSTEDFIDLARPGLLALLLLRILDAIKPWQWTGGDATRDTWRVRTVWTLLPWTRSRWRTHVGRLARTHSNTDLVNALKRRSGEFTILTLGFHPIVEPLVAALGLPEATVIGSRIHSFADRRNGKLNAAVEKLGSAVVSASLVVTDSLDDLPLLARCARPLRTIWPGAQFRRALGKVYIPGEYTTQIKRPGERFIWRVVLQEDLAFWVLATVGLAPRPLAHVAGLTILLASFWTIYERGYVDNDWVAAHLERDGKLTANYWHSPVATPWLQPWIWATAIAAAATYLIAPPAGRLPVIAAWMCVLLATYATFKLYNRVDKSSRIWFFAALQFARGAAPLAIVPVSLAGTAGLAALVIARWVPYYIYRLSKGQWPTVQGGLIRLLFFLTLAAFLACAAGPKTIFNWTSLALLLWNLVRARSELIPMLAGIRRLRQPGPHSTP